jgi:hypothetical protein
MKTQIRGELSLSHLDSDSPFYIEKVFGLDTSSESSLMGVATGDLDGDYQQQHSPVDFISPVYISGESPVMMVDFEDQLKKPYPLNKAYEITVMIAYVEKNDELEKIEDTVLKRQLYERAIRVAVGGFSSSET